MKTEDILPSIIAGLAISAILGVWSYCTKKCSGDSKAKEKLLEGQEEDNEVVPEN